MTLDLSEEEIERRFAEADEAWRRERGREAKATWTREGGRKPNDFGTKATPEWEEILAEFDVHVDAWRAGKVIIDVTLPTSSREPERRRLVVSKGVDAFLSVASDVNDYLPGDENIRSAQTAFADHFQLAFGATAEDRDYVGQVGAELFACKYDMREHRAADKIWRSPQAFKKCLLAEANRFHRCVGWRADSPLASVFAEGFRTLAGLIYQLPRGQANSSDPNRTYVEMVMELGGEAMRRELLAPGRKFSSANDSGHQSSGRQALLDSVRRRRARLEPLGVTEASVRKALHHIDRRRPSA